MLETVESFIANIGFPIFISLYVLMRIEPLIKNLQFSVDVLSLIVARSNHIDYNDVCKIVKSNEKGG